MPTDTPMSENNTLAECPKCATPPSQKPGR